MTGAIEQVGVAVDTVENSTEVQAKIGTPVKCVPTGEQRQQQDGENVEITQILSVEGPEGKGEGEVVIVFDAETFKWSTKSIKVTIDGETINLSDEGDFSLDIDDSGRISASRKNSRSMGWVGGLRRRARWRRCRSVM